LFRQRFLHVVRLVPFGLTNEFAFAVRYHHHRSGVVPPHVALPQSNPRLASRKAARWLQNRFRMVCAGLPLAPLISRWTRALWSAGLPRILQHSRESSLLPTISSRGHRRADVRRCHNTQTPLAIPWFPTAARTSVTRGGLLKFGVSIWLV
jgi:hypothetical protein